MKRLGILDSGVGAFSFYPHLCRLLDAELCFAIDNAQFPYGEKSKEIVETTVLDVADRLNHVAKLDGLLVACNTASTVVLEKLRQWLEIPIIGVVPAIKPAAMMSQKKAICLLATRATVERHYTKDLISEFASQCEVLKIGSAELVLLAESKLAGVPVDMHVLQNELSALKTSPVQPDVMVLGCTHFPFLRDEIGELFPELQIIDSGEAVAKQVAKVLNTNPMGSARKLESRVFFTDVKKVSDSMQKILRNQFNARRCDQLK